MYKEKHQHYSYQIAVAAHEHITEKNYWLHKLAGNPVKTCFFPDLPGRDGSEIPNKSMEFAWSGELFSQLNALSQGNDYTLHIILAAGLMLLLARHTGSEDILIGSPIYKQDVNIEFINTILVYRNSLSPGISFKELLLQVRQTVLEAAEHLNYPFPVLLEQLNIPFSGVENPLFDAVLLLENIHDKKYIREVAHNICFSFTRDSEAIRGLVEYNSCVYREETIRRIVHHYSHLLEKTVSQPGTLIEHIDMLTSEEKETILEHFSHTPPAVQYPGEKTLQQLFARQAELTPDHTALTGPNPSQERLGDLVQLSYRELDERTNRIASALIEKGIRTDNIVGIMVEKSIAMLVGIFGILKAGAAYLPIDPGYPPERRDYMLKDSSASILLKNHDLSSWLASAPQALLNRSAGHPFNFLTSPSSSLAYIIYTSGSTGKPKGVAVEHGNVIANLFAFYAEFAIKAADTVIQLSAYTFDAFVEEVYPVLFRGGKLAIPGPAEILDLHKLEDFIIQHDVNIIDCTPLLLKEINNLEHLNRVHTIISGGEVLKAEYVSRLLATGSAPRKIYNTYGPSETTVCATYYRYNGEPGTSIPIGKPIANYHVYLLDGKLDFVPLGAIGEICVSGPGVTRGYLNRPEMTAEKFCLRRPGAPFEKTAPGPRKNFLLDHSPITNHQLPIYRTGDLGRWLFDGNIEYLGRKDFQVKIRGFRIETGEIEALLRKKTGIKEAVVTARQGKKGEKYLCAYCTAEKATAAELKQYLQEKLPGYMVPAFFVFLEKISLTAAGKIDRQALPEPVITNAKEYVPPQGPIQTHLQKIWHEIFELQPIGIYDNFFEIGGHSLRAIQTINTIHQEMHVKITIAEIFLHPTIKELAEVIKGAATTIHSPIEPLEKKEYYEISHSQKRVWVVSQFKGGLEAFNMPGAYLLTGPLDKDALKNGFAALVQRHESLRTVFFTLREEPKQRIRSKEMIGFKVEEIDLGQVEDKETTIRRLANAEENIRFDLTCGPLLRVKLLCWEQEKHLFLFNMHHIISDALSTEILLAEMLTLYEAFKQEKTNPLPPLRIHYKDFSAWQKRQLSGAETENHRRFWLGQLGGELPVLEMPTDKKRPVVMSYSGETVSLPLDKEITRQLKFLGHQYDATLFIVLAAALNLFLYGYTNQTDIIIGTPTAGREHADLDNQVGYYLNTIPLRTRFTPRDTFGELLQKTLDISLAAFNHQGYPFDRLVEDLGVERDIGRHPVFDVMLNMIAYNPHPDSTALPAGALKITPFAAGYHKTKFDLTVYIYEEKTTLTVIFEYNVDLFEKPTVLLMLKRFSKLLRYIVTNFSAPLSDLLLKEQIRLSPVVPDAAIPPSTASPGPLQFRASYHQERLWFIDRFEAGYLYDGSPVYHNIPLILKLRGPVDVELLEKSIRSVIRRHNILRTRIVTIDNKPFQVVDPGMDFQLHRLTANSNPAHQAAAESKRPFNPAQEPLIRAALIVDTPPEFRLVITLHHIIADKKSLEIFVREMILFYEALIRNNPPELPGIEIHYTDYSRWQSQFPPEVIDSLLFYWRRKLRGKLHPLEMPTDKPRAKIHTYHEAAQSFTLTKELTRDLGNYLRQEKVEPFVYLLAVFKILLHIYCAQEEIIIGTSVDNRDRGGAGVETLIGPVANLLVLRSSISPGSTFQKIVTDLRQTVKEAHRFRDMPFDRLVLALNPAIDMSRTALFDVLFRFEPHPPLKTTMANAVIEPLETNLGWGKYDLNLLIQSRSDEQGEFFAGILVYNADYYDDSRMARLIAHYRVLAESCLNDPSQILSQLDLLTPSERQQLLWDWNDKGWEAEYPKEKCIHEIFVSQAVRAPDHIAALGQSAGSLMHLSYRELNEKSHGLAHLLQEKGIRPDTVAALLSHRSPELIIGILAILKAGGAYLPLDPDYPAERIDYMLKDSNAKMLVTTGTPAEEGEKVRRWEGEKEFEIVFLNTPFSPALLNPDLPNFLTSQPPNFPLFPATGHRPPATSLAYIIYTSGTTGRPKGVMVEHRNLVSLLFHNGFSFDFNPRDIWTLFHSHCFDFSVWEIFGPLLYGGKLIIIPKTAARDTERYVSLVRRHGVTVLNQTPSAFYRFIAVEMNRKETILPLRYIIFGGEALSPGKLKGWRERYPHTRLINMFGITETTVHVTYKEITAKEIEADSGNIGKPIPTLTSYVMDEQQRLVPIGLPGELHIGGAGVSRGYLNRPGLTAERYIANPHKPNGYERLYRSGDRVRCGENGELDYRGRIDHQVQVRGFRVEPGEIQNRLLRHPVVKEAVVIAKEDTHGDKYLCAYTVSRETVAATELRDWLSQGLPDYMIPSFFIKINKIPLTPHGKVDRGALPEPKPETGLTYTTPRNEIEKKLVEIYAAVLSRNPGHESQLLQSIGIDDNFFHLGGHSLKAAALVSRIHKEKNIKLPLAQIFTTPTIKELANQIEKAAVEEFVSLEPLEKKEYYPLSAAQKRLYVLQQFQLDGTAYNLPQIFQLEGKMDPPALTETFRKLSQRHENLRTSFVMVRDEPVQRIHDRVEFAIEKVLDTGITKKNERKRGSKDDNSPAFPKNQELRAKSFLSSFIRPFDFSRAPLLRVGLLQTGAERFTLFIDMHHIITDATSQQILVKEFWAVLASQSLPPLKLGYKDFAQWQNSEPIKKAIRHQERYWLEEFQGEIPLLTLPLDYLNPSFKSFEGNSTQFSLEPPETRALKALAAENHATLYMILLAIFNVFLGKLSGQEDIIVGTAVAGRRHADIENIIGMFVTTLALRNKPENQNTFGQFLARLRERTLGAFENQDYPFESLLEQLPLERNPGRNPLFDVMFVLQNLETPAVKHTAWKITPDYYENYTSRFDLTLYVTTGEEELFFEMRYCTRLFKEETILRFVRYFKKILGEILKNPGARISQIEILPAEEKQLLLYGFNNTQAQYPRDKSIHRLFEEQVQIKPDHIAVVGKAQHPGHCALTYRELNNKSHRLAHRLREKGFGPGTIVAILLEPTPEIITAILTVLKSGGGYLPIDPETPRERITFILEDSETQFLLTQTHLKEKTIFAGQVLTIAAESLDPSDNGIPLPGASDDPAGPAYMIYTSGTTGEPKGVLITHENVVNYVTWFAAAARLTPADKTLLTSSFAFDLGYTSLYPSLLQGAQLHILPKEVYMLPGRLLDYTGTQGITYLKMTPSLFSTLVENSHFSPETCPRLRLVVLGGEAIQAADVEKALQRCHHLRIMNHYGPTEVTIGCIARFVDAHDLETFNTTPTIGKPIANTKAYILSPYFTLQPLGIAGELCLSGAGVARGYFKQDALNREKFLELAETGRERIYRTGDRARWLPGGNIQFLGRIDQQVKIRGYRIELAEIESRLARHKDIKEAVVLVRDKETVNKYLCAYIVPAAPHPGDSLTPRELKKFLSAALPEYMVPSYFIQLEQLPLTPNGKVDKESLPPPGPGIETGLVSPRDITEKMLAGIWLDVLPGNLSLIGIHNNFFEMGGHSLNAVRMISKIHKAFNVEIPLAEVFKNPTITGLSAYIRESGGSRIQEQYTPLEPGEKREYYPLSAAQKRMFILRQMDPQSTAYNMPQILPLAEEIDMASLAEAFAAAIRRHESLRTSFPVVNNEPLQRIHDKVAFAMEYFDLGGEESTGTIIGNFIRPFDTARAPLLRVGLVKLPGSAKTEGDTRRLLLVDMHHIISDGVSSRLLSEDLMRLYRCEQLPRLRLGYKDFSQWQNSVKEKDRLKQQAEYWLREFPGEPPLLRLPLDYPRPRVWSFQGDSLPYTLSPAHTAALKNLAMQENVTLYMLLLAILSILLAKLSRQEDIVTGTPVVGRKHADLERIIGMFVNTLAIRNYPEGTKPFNRFLQEIKQKVIDASENQEYPFEELVNRLTIPRDTGRNPLFDVMLVLPLQGEQQNRPPAHARYENRTARFDLTVYAAETTEGLEFHYQYCTKLFKRETIQRFITYFNEIISSLLEAPGILLGEVEIITGIEKEQLLHDFNQPAPPYPAGKTLQELFAEQVARTPDHLALLGPTQAANDNKPTARRAIKSFDQTFSKVWPPAGPPVDLNAWGDAHLTYKELHEKAGQVANVLKAKGICADTIIAFMVERSIEMVIGILGILTAGAVYMPIDPEYPQERIDYMLKDSSAKMLVTTGTLVEEGQEVRRWEGEKDFELVFLNTPFSPALLNPGLPNFQTSQPPNFPLFPATGHRQPATSLAYVIYTSGTTGQPKGVMIQQQNMVQLLFHEQFPWLFEFNCHDTWTLFHSINFDFSAWELYGALLLGGKAVVVPKITAMDTRAFLTLLRKERVTILNQTPSSFYRLAEEELTRRDNGLAHLRYVIFGGEALSPLKLRQWKARYPGTQLINMFGITETTIHVTYKKIGDQEIQAGLSNIGKPLPPLHTYLVDNHLKLVPVGIPGELLVAGAGVGRGYLNQPELTHKKFINYKLQNTNCKQITNKEVPFGQLLNACGEKTLTLTLNTNTLYKTGDLARWLPEGNMEYLGRIDQQVKIRGFRIETGEIETRLLAHGMIQGAVVTTGEDNNGDKYLCAYIVPAAAGKEIDSKELREYLSSFLPGYMVPAYMIPLEKIPLTPNGKTDRKALPEPGVTASARYLPPSNPVELILAVLWADILELAAGSISIDADFFQLGGHSLKAARMASALQHQFKFPIPLVEIFKNPTIRELAQYITPLQRAPKEIPEDLHQDENLVLLRRGANQAKNLFLIHAGSGEADAYLELCNHLGPGFDYWGIKASPIINYTPQNITVEETAQTYVQKIRKVQASGPYYIAGWCAGGTIAFEMVRQLETINEKISFFALFNALAPEKNRAANKTVFTLAGEIAEILADIMGKGLKKRIKGIKALDELWPAVIAHLKETGYNLEKIKSALPPTISEATPQFQRQDLEGIFYYAAMIRTIGQARDNYLPSGKINARVHFFSANRAKIANRKNWNHYCSHPVEFHEVEGNHYSLFREPDLKALAESLQGVIDNALANPGKGKSREKSASSLKKRKKTVV